MEYVYGLHNKVYILYTGIRNIKTDCTIQCTYFIPVLGILKQTVQYSEHTLFRYMEYLNFLYNTVYIFYTGIRNIKTACTIQCIYFIPVWNI